MHEHVTSRTQDKPEPAPGIEPFDCANHYFLIV
jgi:hypothetical protein